MALKSRIFKGDPRLEACLLRDSAHVVPGAHGDHVAKIQGVVMLVDNVQISERELKAHYYGPSTAAAVLAFKKKRKIINFSYQTHADDIVGKMTIQALDDELQAKQKPTIPLVPQPCRINPGHDSISRGAKKNRIQR